VRSGVDGLLKSSGGHASAVASVTCCRYSTIWSYVVRGTGCGLRLAATAGTDTLLSFLRLGTASNPPGWGRVYANLDHQPLSVTAFKDAVRAGRTIVTNGPWLALQVNWDGPGSVLDLAVGARLDTGASVAGPGVEHVALVGPDGVLPEVDAEPELRVEGLPGNVSEQVHAWRDSHRDTIN
jgi:hypothetical protein